MSDASPQPQRPGPNHGRRVRVPIAVAVGTVVAVSIAGFNGPSDADDALERDKGAAVHYVTAQADPPPTER